METSTLHSFRMSRDHRGALNEPSSSGIFVGHWGLGAPRPAAGKLQPMRPTHDEDENALVACARSGDQLAFEELVRRHADRLYAVVLRFLGDRQEAEEVTQDTFLRAWKSIGRFKGDSQFFTWLYRIGINEAKRRLGRKSSEAKVISLDEHPRTEAADWKLAPETNLDQVELRAVLERAIQALEPDYRAPLILRDVEGLSTSEAAEVMDLGEAALKSRLHRARLAVREAIDEYLGGDDK